MLSSYIYVLKIQIFAFMLINNCYTLDGKVTEEDNREWENLRVKEGKFPTYLNHFNPDDSRIINLRYLQYFKTYNHVLVLEIGGQYTIKEHMVFEYPGYEFAERYEAQYIFIEHRFYGKSKPSNFSGVSPEDIFSEKYLQYLNADQALEDLAYFIDTQRNEEGFTAVVVFGCTYAGTLALWLQRKIPMLVNAVYSSHSPLHYINTNYSSVVNKTLNKNCVSLIQSWYEKVKGKMEEDISNNKNKRIWECGNADRDNIRDVLDSLHAVITDRHNYPVLEKFCSVGDGLRFYDVIRGLSCKTCSRKHVTMLYTDHNDYLRQYQLCSELAYHTAINTTDISYPSIKNLLNFCEDTFPFLNFSKVSEENLIRREVLHPGKRHFLTPPKCVVIVNAPPIDDFKAMWKNNDEQLLVKVLKGLPYCTDYRKYRTRESNVRRASILDVLWKNCTGRV